MEIKETAACGIAEREFAIDLDEDEVKHMERLIGIARDQSLMEAAAAQKLLDKIQEDKPTGQVSLPFKDTEIRVFHAAMKGAAPHATPAAKEFADDMFLYMEQIVGSDLGCS